MKRIVVAILVVVSGFINAQSYEWMESLEYAKKLAAIQNKMLFAMWEDAVLDLRTPLYIDGKPTNRYVSVLESDFLNEIIWEKFVPVILKESDYESLYAKIEGKHKIAYIDKFNDDTVKIMDVNGYILNTKLLGSSYLDFEFIAERYGLNTVFLSEELKSYSKTKNFVTSYRLANRYFDFAIINNKDLESEIIDMAFIYLNQAEGFIAAETEEDHAMLTQKCGLLRLSKDAIKGNPRKLLRRLNRIEEERPIHLNNQALFDYLQFTAYTILEDFEKAEPLRSKVSLVDLKKINLLLTKNKT